MATTVEIYTTRSCPYCAWAKGLLDRKGVGYVETDVGNDDGRRRWLLEKTGQATVPQVFVDGRALGGYDDLLALDAGGELDPILGL